MSDRKRLAIRNSTAEFLIFTLQAGEDGIEVRYEDETIWLTQKLMAELFSVTVPTINEHLRNIFDSGELDADSVIRKFRITASDNKSYKTQFYNSGLIENSVVKDSLTTAVSGELVQDSVCANFAHTGADVLHESNYRGLLGSSNKGVTER